MPRPGDNVPDSDPDHVPVPSAWLLISARDLSQPFLAQRRNFSSFSFFCSAAGRYVLRDLVDLMHRKRIVLPGYTYLQDLVRRALTFERHRISGALSELIRDDDMRLVARLLKDDQGLHAIGFTMRDLPSISLTIQEQTQCTHQNRTT